ncbi:MAG: type III PLP-dependent enzyme, partial [Candidatus Levybacteria bacterium]|nr:type III PLP-dependent enzyme [Candidatus Levybacteria bacterium]
MNNQILNEFKPEYLETLVHETPYFLFSKNKIASNYKEYTKYFPTASIQYAMKANSEPELLQVLNKAGSGFEVASEYELEYLKKLHIDPKKIVYGSSIKPIKSIKKFVAYGVDRFAFDSLPELEKIAAVAPGARVYVRMTANDSGSVYKFSEKFGTEIDNVVSLLIRARELGLKPYGISFHVGSQASNELAWGNALKRLAPVLKELQQSDITIDIINIGGGYPCEYLSNIEMPTLEAISKHVYT